MDSSTNQENSRVNNNEITNRQSINGRKTYMSSNTQISRNIENSVRDDSLKKEKEKENVISRINTSVRSKQNQNDSRSIEQREIEQKERESVVLFMKQIKLIKENISTDGLVQKLHKICRDGVLFYDLVMKMEGRGCRLQGINRKPKNNAQILHNYS